jgi:hypothetical protein
MYQVILYTCQNPEITNQMIELYIKKTNLNPRFNRERTIDMLKNRNFIRHDSSMVEVIKELNCSGFKIVELSDDEWRYYHIKDEKIIIS